MLLELLGSMNLAIALLVTVAVASVVGTVLLQNQPYNQYYDRFGEFWFHAFRTLGLYDVYSSAWFLGILGFLVVSTSVCIYRHAPAMLRDMGHFRLNVQRKSLHAFHHRQEWRVPAPAEGLARLGARYLHAQGYRVRVRDHGEHLVVAAMKGALNRLGYLFTHSAIVIVCLGGLVDGNLGLKLKELAGEIEVQREDMLIADIPPRSRLAPGDSLSFRGNRTVPEGSTVNGAVLNVRDGYVLQELPFAIEVKEFRVEHYESGQPKSFESDLVIHDDRLEAPLEQTIAVNHPLTYRGYAIYQSSFSDGGSRLQLEAWPLSAAAGGAVEVSGRVFGEIPLQGPDGGLTVEITDFRPHNINPVEQEASGRKFRNWGPSFTYTLRDPSGEAREFHNYMQPVEREGRLFYMSGVRAGPAEPFRYLHIPADPDGGLDRYMHFRRLLHDEARVREIVAEYVRQGLADRPGGDAAMRQRLSGSVIRMVQQFAAGELDRTLEAMARDLPPERLERMRDAYLELLVNALGALYREVLQEEGVDVSQGVTDTADRRFFEDAFETLGAVSQYGSPFYLQLKSFEHVEATGLQITRAPGKNLVYAGCMLLIAGIFIMFYLPQRRAWLHLQRRDGATDVSFAAASNRRQLDLDHAFERMGEELGRGLGAGR
ncbi:MAG: cytochrome c biogenesis protein ResB [Gammaproteobacteria bacterium]|nr:cytochrome c biogenesis protein ResB [Gammaproteobacteria bacterium]